MFLERTASMNGVPNMPTSETGWEVTGITSAEQFFSALAEILPLPAYLRFEGTSISPDIRAMLESNAVAPTLQIASGTIWPKPAVFHVLATVNSIREISELAGRHAESEICDHFHAYNESHLLMQWYDAFDLPLLISDCIPEESVCGFCRRIGVSYTRRRPA